MVSFLVFGLLDRCPELSVSNQKLVRQSHYFSGAPRHRSLVKPLLPTSARWIDLSSPLERTFHAYEQLKGQSVVVFVSGDPLLFGFGNTLLRRFPDSKVRFFPSVSSVQHLCHVAKLPYDELVVVSLHGRNPDSLYRELLRQTPRIAVLTDEKYTLHWLAQTLLDYGYDNYTLWVGENLDSETEKVRHYSLKEVAETSFSALNVGLLVRKHKRVVPFGIPDKELMGLENRPNMITKMPIRLSTLHALRLSDKRVFWDIGFCTGAVSIEAKLRHPELCVVAFEKRLSCQDPVGHKYQTLGCRGYAGGVEGLFAGE